MSSSKKILLDGKYPQPFDETDWKLPEEKEQEEWVKRVENLLTAYWKR